MSDSQAVTVLTDGTEAPAQPTGDIDFAELPAGRRGWVRRFSREVVSTALLAWSCSSVLGAGDPWLGTDVTQAVSLEAPQTGAPVRISLAEARRLAIEFNERIDRGYRLRAQAEAEEEAAWEEEG